MAIEKKSVALKDLRHSSTWGRSAPFPTASCSSGSRPGLAKGANWHLRPWLSGMAGSSSAFAGRFWEMSTRRPTPFRRHFSPWHTRRPRSRRAIQWHRGCTRQQSAQPATIERSRGGVMPTNAPAAAARTERIEPAEPQDGLERLIHQEIERLPARYKTTIVLCDLEGCTHEQAARHLGCAVGTIKSRLAQGRSKLQGRLLRRGIAPLAGIVTAASAGAGGGFDRARGIDCDLRGWTRGDWRSNSLRGCHAYKRSADCHVPEQIESHGAGDGVCSRA